MGVGVDVWGGIGVDELVGVAVGWGAVWAVGVDVLVDAAVNVGRCSI